MVTDRDNLAAILERHLKLYRDQTHDELAARLEQSHDHLDVTYGTTSDGTKYTIETNVLWDDHSKREIRVMADLTTENVGCLLGIIPIYTPNVADSFILAPNGMFVGE